VSALVLPVESSVLYSPVGLRLLDELTGVAPLGSVQSQLDIQDAGGNWRLTNITEVRTPSAVVTYPGLGRCVSPAGRPPQPYRIRLSAEFYIPYYQAAADAIPFPVYAYNDTNAPAVIVQGPTDTPLVPGPNYPFPTHVRVLRGVVVDATGKSVPNALVTQGNTERTLTDARGIFALPLRWVAAAGAVPIDATDQRTGRTGVIQAQLPAALNTSQTIQIA
jgi:hypothetical protein